MEDLKPKYYMGAEVLTVLPNIGSRGLKTYDTFEDARDAVSATVAESGKPRFIVKTVAFIEPQPPPVRVTIIG